MLSHQTSLQEGPSRLCYWLLDSVLKKVEVWHGMGTSTVSSFRSLLFSSLSSYYYCTVHVLINMYKTAYWKWRKVHGSCPHSSLVSQFVQFDWIYNKITGTCTLLVHHDRKPVLSIVLKQRKGRLWTCFGELATILYYYSVCAFEIKNVVLHLLALSNNNSNSPIHHG